MIVAGFIWKGIPYLLQKFDETTLLFSKALTSQQVLFKEELAKISHDFLQQIKETNTTHTVFHIRQEEQGKKIEEIYAIISRK